MLASVHQPREAIGACIDDLSLLSRGKIVYAGLFSEAEMWFAALGFERPPRFNATDFLLDLLGVDARSSDARRASIERIETCHRAWRRASSAASPRPSRASVRQRLVFFGRGGVTARRRL